MNQELPLLINDTINYYKDRSQWQKVIKKLHQEYDRRISYSMDDEINPTWVDLQLKRKGIKIKVKLYGN
jgi:hypothetical protein